MIKYSNKISTLIILQKNTDVIILQKIQMLYHGTAATAIHDVFKLFIDRIDIHINTHYIEIYFLHCQTKSAYLEQI